MKDNQYRYKMTFIPAACLIMVIGTGVAVVFMFLGGMEFHWATIVVCALSHFLAFFILNFMLERFPRR